MKPPIKIIDYFTLITSILMIVYITHWCSQENEDRGHPLPLNNYKNRALHGMMNTDDFVHAIEVAFAEKEYKLVLLFTQAIPNNHSKFGWAQQMAALVKIELKDKLTTHRNALQQSIPLK